MTKLILVPLLCAFFFSFIAEERRGGRLAWGGLSLVVFGGGFLAARTLGFPGFWGGVVGEVLLFVIITLIWFTTPRRSTAQILADIETERQAREDQRLMQRHD